MRNLTIQKQIGTGTKTVKTVIAFSPPGKSPARRKLCLQQPFEIPSPTQEKNNIQVLRWLRLR